MRPAVYFAGSVLVSLGLAAPPISLPAQEKKEPVTVPDLIKAQTSLHDHLHQFAEQLTRLAKKLERSEDGNERAAGKRLGEMAASPGLQAALTSSRALLDLLMKDDMKKLTVAKDARDRAKGFEGNLDEVENLLRNAGGPQQFVLHLSSTRLRYRNGLLLFSRYHQQLVRESLLDDAKKDQE